MAKLTQHAGGGVLYTPAMMQFNGTCNLYSSGIPALPANKFELFISFSSDSIAANQGLMMCSESGGGYRFEVSIVGNGGDSTIAGKVQLRAWGGPQVASIFSETVVTDNKKHLIYISLNADTGELIFNLDGVHEDQLDAVGRIEFTASTLEEAAGFMWVGSRFSASEQTSGIIGTVGYNNGITNQWSDFINSEGIQKEFDGSAWDVYLPYCDLDNRGTAVDFSIVGTGAPVVSDGHATGHPLLGINTTGTAVASNIDHGRTTWVDGVEVVGTAPGEGGGGLLYTPAMMEFGSGYYSHAGITVSGNNFTIRARINVQESVDNQWVVNVTQGSAIIRIVVMESDHATASNLLQFFVYGSSLLCLTYTDIDVTNIGTFMVHASFDGDTGTVVLRVNNIDVDDISHIDRVAVPGTVGMTSGATEVGSVSSGSTPLLGDIGSFAFDDQFHADDSDYTDAGGTPKDFDGTGWKIYNPHGNMTDNRGTAGNMTVNGTVVISDAGSTGHPMIGVDTVGDAVASDIAEDKIAWVDGAEVVGTFVDPIPGLLVLDNFTDPNDTVLDAHTPDIDVVGGGWIMTAAETRINNNRPYPYTTTGETACVIETNEADVQIDCIMGQTTGAGSAILFRYVAGGNTWMFYRAGTQTILYEWDGSLTNRGQATIIEGDIVARIILSGDSIKCYVNSILKFDITNSFNNTATKHGFRMDTAAGLTYLFPDELVIRKLI